MIAEVTQLGGLAGWVLDVIQAMGPVGVGLLVVLETVFPPIPSEVVLPLAGFVAGQGKLPLPAVIVAATSGSVAGALLLYWAGAALGPQRLRKMAARMPLMEPGDIDRAQGWFNRHGGSAVLFGRLVPGVRSLVSIPAGVARMPLPQFVAYTAVGSGAFNAVLVLLGYELGHQWRSVDAYGDLINYGIYLLLTGVVGVAAVRRARSKRRSRRTT